LITNKEVNTQINNICVILFVDPPNPIGLNEITLLPVGNLILQTPVTKCYIQPCNRQTHQWLQSLSGVDETRVQFLFKYKRLFSI